MTYYKIFDKFFYKFFALLFLLPAFAAMLTAQTTSFKAVCDVSSTAIGQPFELTFRLENARVKEMKLPNLADFDVMGPATTIAQSYVHGKSSQVEAYTYILSPKRAGKLTIGAATVKTNTGLTFSSQAVVVSVSKTPTANNNQNNGNANTAQQGGQGQPIGELGDKVLVKVVASNNSPVVGEQVVVDFRIYTLIDIKQIDLVRAPRAADVFAHDIRTLDDPAQTATIGGKNYTYKTLHRAVIFPAKSGKLKIEGGQVQLGVYLNNESAFFGQLQNFRVAAEPLEINVVQPANMPDDFKGSVGEYSMRASIENPRISTDDALRLIVKIEGTGDLKQVFPPKIEFPDGSFQVFPPNASENIVDNGRALGGSKTFEYILTPLAVGDFSINPKFQYYNPTLGKFVTAESPQNVSISLGKNPIQKPKKPAKDSSATAEKTVLTPRAPMTTTQLRPVSGTTFFGTWYFYLVLLLLPPAAFFARRWQQLQSQKPETQAKAVQKTMKNTTNAQLEKANALMQSGDAKGFYEELAQALNLYISHQFNIPFAELQKARIEKELTEKGITESQIKSLQQTLQNCEMALYAGLTSKDSMQSSYKAAQDFIQVVGSKS